MADLPISYAADVKAEDEIGETTLDCASRCGHIEIARALKKAGVE